jgi:hypothetical protein
MAVVLVIIGFIVGGILVGQSLVGAASVRAQISQIEKYQTAVNTFRGKYGYLPGDIPSGPAAQFGFASRPSWGPGTGNGDGTIQGMMNSGGGYGYQSFGNQIAGGETALFWEDLSSAGLIEGTFNSGSATNYTNWVVTSTTATWRAQRSNTPSKSTAAPM